jgi:pimeloyl-ACP methyl ester carboxylesterase
MLMTPAEAAPQPVEVQRLLATARVEHSPCGEGAMVWHLWGQGAPVVLLHGGSGSWTHWLRNIEALAASGRQVLVPDMPGFGDSASPFGGTDADVLPEPIEAGLAQVLGSRPCDLVGFSFGGMTAGLFTVKFPQRVDRLVVVGAPALGVVPSRVVPLTPWRHLDDPQQRRAIFRDNLRALMLARPESLDDLALALHEANIVRDRMRNRTLAMTDVLARALATVTCPVHAIYGREDALYRNRQDVLLRAFGAVPMLRELVMIDDAGHWVQYERAGPFNAALLAALSPPIFSTSSTR